MKLFGFEIGTQRAMPFAEFRDHVRMITRRAMPGAQFEHRDFGFVMVREGKPPAICSLRALYAEYAKRPSERDGLVERFLRTLTTEIPAHSWPEAQSTLRPVLKNAGYLEQARLLLEKNGASDTLPSEPFAGDLSLIVMREVAGRAVAVTRSTLDSWGIGFDEAKRHAVDNLNMRSFPSVTGAQFADGSASGVGCREEIALIFDGDHLTASWMVVPRFRDYIAQRLQGDVVVTVPTRSRLTAVRADEPDVLAQIQAKNRCHAGQLPWLTGQAFHICSDTTGGVVTVLASMRRAASSGDLPRSPACSGAPLRLNPFGGLAEGTENRDPSGRTLRAS